MVFTTRFSGGKGGRNGLEAELRRLGVTQKNSRPNHPTTCGKVERFQQTMKRWLVAQPNQPETVEYLQVLLDLFVVHYNDERPHRSLPERSTPSVAYRARPKAAPGDRRDDKHDRVRHDVIDKAGRITLRVDRAPPPHRARANPRAHPRPRACPRPRGPRRPRRDRRAPEEPRRRSNEGLPRDGCSEGTDATSEITELKVQGVSYVLRHHKAPPEGFEPATNCLEGSCSVH